MSENKVKMTQAQFDALPTGDASMKIYSKHSMSWIKTTIYLDPTESYGSGLRMRHEEIEICEEEKK